MNITKAKIAYVVFLVLSILEAIYKVIPNQYFAVVIAVLLAICGVFGWAVPVVSAKIKANRLQKRIK